MSYNSKPIPKGIPLRTNALGLTARDYEGSMSTLCAGCGHDSITAALIQAVFQMDIEPHRVMKISGIGCSSKTPTYFMGQSHGFNTVHGRMPAVATGAHGANRGIYCIGVSGDGDSLSIGLGQFAHAVRRNVNMLYLLENNGVYGLTKGQFSASADIGSKSKKGVPNQYSPIDPVIMALSLGASFVARAFSGDKEQLIPLIKAGLHHRGFAFIDVISPCITFNDHEASTKSYLHTRENYHKVVHADYIAPAEEIEVEYEKGCTTNIQMHDGSRVALRKIDEAYDPTDPIKAHAYIREHQAKGEIVTGLLYLNGKSEDLHTMLGTVDEPLNEVPFEKLCPMADALDRMQEMMR